jgi:hypothetical protein
MTTLLLDQSLRERAPAFDLADTLVCAWRGDLGELRTPLPDECLDLFWVDDGSIWPSGRTRDQSVVAFIHEAGSPSACASGPVSSTSATILAGISTAGSGTVAGSRLGWGGSSLPRAGAGSGCAA